MTSFSPPLSFPSRFSQVGHQRLESIDLLRGIVMIIMALDHVRVYFHFDSFLFSATDLQKTNVWIFLTRMITHLCAPTFILLAGTSTYLISKRKGLKEASFFLVTRGLWLVALQFTLIRFAWNFDPQFHFNSSNIISTIGFCMIGLAAIIRFPLKWIFAFGVVVILGHNALDRVSFAPGTLMDVIWSFLHVRKTFAWGDHQSFLFLYPFIPWIGVIALGYCLGRLFENDVPSENRRLILIEIGIGMLLMFLLLRAVNIYGDPVPWTAQQDLTTSLMSFFNVEKYPPSLLYLMLMLGTAISILGFLERSNCRRASAVSVFGKVAFFYYVLHIFVIHGLALIFVVLLGYPLQTMVFYESQNVVSPVLKGVYGFSLPVVYVIWIAVVVGLYPLCSYWNDFKVGNKSKWWVGYV